MWREIIGITNSGAITQWAYYYITNDNLMIYVSTRSTKLEQQSAVNARNGVINERLICTIMAGVTL